MAYSGITVTDEQLKDLLNTPSFVLTNLNKKDTTKKILNERIGTPHSKNKVCGIYMFTHVSTGKKYVGSSSELALRLNGYINLTHKRTGLLMALLEKEKLNNFSLEIYPFFSNQKKKSDIVLEKYYLLNPMFTLNTIRVANNPSGSNAKCLYMYNRDPSVLYYSSTQQVDFISNLNLHHTSFTKHLKNGTYYLGKYLFLREPILEAKVKDMSLSKMTLMLEADRVKFNKNKPLNSLCKPVLMTDIHDLTASITLPSLGKCIEHYRNKGLSVHQKTLTKYIKIAEAYHGYICKYV